MLKYIWKRLLLMIPVIVGLSFILFCIMELTPGDPARSMLGEYATQEEVDKIVEGRLQRERSKYGDMSDYDQLKV